MKRLSESIREPRRNASGALHGAQFVAILVCLSVAYPLVSLNAYSAEPGTGLVISRDGANVNVSLDSEASSNVSIRRSDDVMMIRLPKSFSPKLVIDPALKKDSVVEEAETPEGRVITISSQQIYLMTQENLEASPSGSNGRKHAASAMQPAVDTTVSKVADIKPVNLSGKNLAISNQEKSSGKSSSQKAEKPAVLGNAIGLVKISPDLAEAIEKLKQETQSSVSEDAAPGAAKAAEKANTSGAESTELTTINTAAKPGTAAGDPEAQPLDFSGQQQTVALQGSTGGLMRIALSLLTVLALFAAFAKLVLPRMLERYPDFFENLKRQGEERAQTNQERQSFLQSPDRQNVDRDTGFLTPASQGKHSKKNYLERLNVNGDRFNVLTSTPLGKGKELHLVEIRGRQFVVATTPYTVSVLQDLTDALDESDAELYGQETLDGEFEEVYSPEPARIGMREMPQDETTTEYHAPVTDSAVYTQPKTETVAYLSDETPPVSSVKTNPYAARPEPKINRQQQILQQQAQVEQTYLKYVDTPVTATPPPIAPIPPKPAVPPPAQGQETCVEAEEVVVLQDYDDTFGY